MKIMKWFTVAFALAAAGCTASGSSPATSPKPPTLWSGTEGFGQGASEREPEFLFEERHVESTSVESKSAYPMERASSGQRLRGLPSAQ